MALSRGARALSAAKPSLATNAAYPSLLEPARHPPVNVERRAALLQRQQERLSPLQRETRNAESGRWRDLPTRRYSPYGIDPRPAVAGIIGAGREWTVWMVSELSIPCR